MLNTRVLNDVPYFNLISDCINRMKQVRTNNPSEWWELYLFKAVTIPCCTLNKKNIGKCP